MKHFQRLSPISKIVLAYSGLMSLAGLFVIGSLLMEPSQGGGFLGFSVGRWAALSVNVLLLAIFVFWGIRIWKDQTGNIEDWLSSEKPLFWLFFISLVLFGFSLPAGLGKIPAIRYFLYFGRIQPTLLWLALGSGIVFLYLLILLRKSILRWFRQFFPLDETVPKLSDLISVQKSVMIGIALVYVVLQVASHLQVREAIWLPDSIDYIFPAETFSWNEIGLWTHTKPWGAAVLFKLVGSSPVMIDAAQTALSALAWLALAWVMSKVIHRHWLSVIAFGLVLGFGLSPSVQMWNHIIQSESLSISLMVLILATWLSLLRRWHWLKVLALVSLFGWWIGTRETNVYLSLMVAGILVLVGLVFKRQRFYWAISLALVGFCVVNMQISEVPTIPRWLYPLTNTLLNRILPNEEFLTYFQARGLKTSPGLLALSGGLANSDDFAVYNDPALNNVEDWLYRKGKHTYVRFLMDHPVYTLTAPWLHVREILAPSDILGYRPAFLQSKFAQIWENVFFVNSLWLLAVLAGAVVFLVLKSRPWKLPVFWLVFFFLLLFFPHFYLVWHGDAAEVGRHAIQASVQLRLSLWLLFLLAIDSVILMKTDRSLSAEEIENAVKEKLGDHKDLSFLEQYAMFMGKAQILEFGLKGLLTRKYEVPFETMEKWTLGRVKNELSKKRLCQDFIAYLSHVVDYRNYIAHELLANNALTQSIANFSDRKLYGDLFRGIYELEQIIILYNWCEEHNGWE